jgi:hypothetical protein
MTSLRLLLAAAALLTIGACDGDTILDPTASARSTDNQTQISAAAARKVETSGEFAAQVDFSTLSLTPRGRNCLLRVNGRLVFTGTIKGTAIGQTSALVFAPCSKVATTPPGTFRDVFKSELVFEGTVAGEPAEANLLYMGRVRPGGEIEGRLVFSRGISGRLEAEARVAVGGTYSGSVVVQPLR